MRLAADTEARAATKTAAAMKVATLDDAAVTASGTLVVMVRMVRMAVAVAAAMKEVQRVILTSMFGTVGKASTSMSSQRWRLTAAVCGPLWNAPLCRHKKRRG